MSAQLFPDPLAPKTLPIGLIVRSRNNRIARPSMLCQHRRHTKQKQGHHRTYSRILKKAVKQFRKTANTRFSAVPFMFFFLFRCVHFHRIAFSPTNKFNVCAYSIVWNVGTFRKHRPRNIRDFAWPTRLAARILGPTLLLRMSSLVPRRWHRRSARMNGKRRANKSRLNLYNYVK